MLDAELLTAIAQAGAMPSGATLFVVWYLVYVIDGKSGMKAMRERLTALEAANVVLTARVTALDAGRD